MGPNTARFVRQRARCMLRRRARSTVLVSRVHIVTSRSVDATTEQPPDPANEDATLVAALRSGDEAAFILLVRRYQSALLRAALLHVRDRDVAEEVVQEGWIAVMKGLDRFQARSSLKTWIFRIVTNQARTRGSRERRTLPFSSLRPGSSQPSVDPARFRPAGDRWEGHWLEPPLSWGPDASAPLMARETQQVIAATLDELPNAQRTVIWLRDVQGWSSDEVCEALDISPGNQRVLLHRARARVRRALERYFDDGFGRNDRPIARTDRDR